MSIQVLFIGASFHDGKKTRLSDDLSPEKIEFWGTWRPDHLRWDDLCSQGSTTDLAISGDDEKILKASNLILAIKLHQRQFSVKALQFNPMDEPYHTQILGLDRIGLFALFAADAIHKKLYETADDLDDGPPSIIRSPFFTPFYASDASGREICWMPINFTPNAQLPVDDLLPDAVSDDIQFGNSRALFGKFFKEFLYVLREEEKNPTGSVRFTAEKMIEWQKRYFAAFPDTTYLPTTSLGFHHRFVAAIFLLIEQHLRERDSDVVQASHKIDIPLYLNAILCPPEVLTNRLRDTSLVRKITHRLQIRLHDYFTRRPYLQNLEELGFGHPDLNPFFFYNKDLILLINGDGDKDAIGRICHEVAKETESVITLNTRPIKASVTIHFNQEALGSRKQLGQTNVFDIETKNETLGVEAAASMGESDPSAFLGVPPTLAISQSGTEEAHCFVCNKAVEAENLITDSVRDDELCERCDMLRRKHRFCEACNVYFQALKPNQRQPEPCVLCGEDAGWPQTSRFLEGRGGENYRVAYVALKINAALEGIALEAEARMAQFRHLRARFEKPRTGRGSPRLILKPSRFADLREFTDFDQKILSRIDDLMSQKEYGIGELASELEGEGLRLSSDQIREKLAEYVGRGILSAKDRMRQLARTTPTGSSLFEYLQAAMNINQFQDDLKDRFRETLQEVQHRQRNSRHNFEGYHIQNADWTDEALDQHILYRSPTTILFVMPEPALRLFYPKLLRLTQDLHIAHKLRIATCAYNTPVWWVLDELKLDKDEEYLSTGLKKEIQGLRDLQNQIDNQTGDANLILEVWEKSECIRKKYQEVAHPFKHISLRMGKDQTVKLSPQEITLTVIRGSAPRLFKDEIAHHLLTFHPQSKAAPAQVHWLAEYASQLSAEVKSDKDLEWFRASLDLEIDARSNPSRRMSSSERLPMPLATEIKSYVRKLVGQIKRGEEGAKIETIPAFLREMANLHKIPTGVDRS